MKGKRYTDEQIGFALRQAEMGTPVAEVCRKSGITEQTFYRWKKKFAGMGVAEIRRLKQLEEENRKLKQQIGIDFVTRSKLRRVRAAINSLKPHTLHQRCDVQAANFVSFTKQ